MRSSSASTMRPSRVLSDGSIGLVRTRATPSAPQHGPQRVLPHDACDLGISVSEHAPHPERGAVDLFVSRREHAGMDEHVSQMVNTSGLREVIEAFRASKHHSRSSAVRAASSTRSWTGNAATRSGPRQSPISSSSGSSCCETRPSGPARSARFRSRATQRVQSRSRLIQSTFPQR